MSTRQRVRAASSTLHIVTANVPVPRFDLSALSKVRQHEGLLDATPDPERRRAYDDLLVCSRPDQRWCAVLPAAS